MRQVAIAIIVLWQRSGISPRAGFRCVHTPSCSEYTKLAINEHGVVHGLRMGWAHIKGCSENT
ncbi:MAG: membrane protein insertion efficiency factor YidD [Ignavibacteria bacterium]|nr:membrane protein insertion efficiency factor YidD [Ignavibacteria bacterium]